MAEEWRGVKWEYLTVTESSDRDSLGRQGWELVAVDKYLLHHFKRPLKPEPPAVMVVNINGRQMDEVLEMIRTELDNYFERPTGG